MIFVWTFLLLIGLAGMGYVGFKYLDRQNVENQKIDSVEALIAKRKESTKFKTPLLLFGFFVSTLYVTMAFDADYKTLVEKKLYVQEVEQVDTLIAMMISSPPPPQKMEEVKPEVIEEEVEVPEIKLVDKVIDQQKKVVTPVDPGPPGPPGPPAPPNNNLQKLDNNIYYPDQLTSNPEFVGGTEACKIFLSSKLYNLKAPAKYRISNSRFTVNVTCVIEPNGTVSSVTIPRKSQVELDEETIKSIIKAFESMPKWTPGMIVDEPKRAVVQLPVTLEP